MSEYKSRDKNTSEHMSLARWKRGSDNFEIVVEPEKALAWKKTKQGDVRDVLAMPKIFSDAKKGMIASEHRLQALFESSDPLVVAMRILTEGDVQLTQEYKHKLLEQNKARLVQLIHKQGVDPHTHAPHPIQRIEAAIVEAKVHIDEFKPAEQQLADVLKQLRPILPIKFEVKEIAITLPAAQASKAFSALKQMSKIIREEWRPDGSWDGTVEIPGGLEQELYDKLNSLTHGSVQAKVIRVIG
ncbi:MAG: ribosome assembly factor SBDS [Candidatus Woesearchaeota archaeon]|nr:ribosome assembly factor SBDS [Candidatus Woesearchaeota archaeon]